MSQSKDLTPQTRKSIPTRIDKTNSTIDSEITKILQDIDVVASDLDAVIEIVRDRVVQSSDPSYPIALARLGELRLDTIKKRIDVIKTLVADKNVEIAAKKRNPTTDLESIMSGAAFGMALGAQVGKGGFGNSKKELDNNIEHDVIDVSNEEFIVDTEHRGSSDSGIDKLLAGE